MTTWTSLRYSLGKSGRSGRSVSRAVRIGVLGGASLALDEAAGDLAGGVHLLFVLDGQREEVDAFARLLELTAVARTMVSP